LRLIGGPNAHVQTSAGAPFSQGAPTACRTHDVKDGALARLQAVGQLGYAFARDPVEGVINLRERIAERGETRGPNGFMPWPPCPYQEDERWEEKLHALLGRSWPCKCAEEFFELWHLVMQDLGRRGFSLGRGAFGGWGDGEPAFVRAVWAIVNHRRPATVLETGVARGLTTRFILEALDRVGAGHLWSIDLPPPLRRDLHQQIGAAVPERLRSRWSYVRGSSSRRLRGVLDDIAGVDVFVHDSRHSERNLLFELRHTWTELRPSGVLIADDIDLNCGFHKFAAEHAEEPSLICLAEPLESDPGRQHERGVFAVVVKRADSFTRPRCAAP
jgi:hypothetical protein